MRSGRGSRVPLRRCGRDGLFLLSIRSWSGAARLPFRRPGVGPSHGGIRRTMRYQSKNMVHSLSAFRAEYVASDNESFCCDAVADGVLMEMPFRKNVSVESHLSCIFPAHSRSLARCLSRARRHVDVLLRPYGRPAGLGFQTKNLPCGCGPKYGRDFFFGASAESTSRPWERGTSRRFAQECSESNPGKYKQGETPWHSTKTT